ncbi:MAG: hypothetical protein KAV25_03270 [Methanophagales archaeon]|nr:hypothetical protein [Methanophagales archaeon]
MIRSKVDKKKNKETKLYWRKWRRWKKSPIAWVALVILSVLISVVVYDFVVYPLSDLFQENDVKIVAVSTINIFEEEHYLIEGEFGHLFGDAPYFREDEEGIYICDLLLPPFPDKNINIDMLGGYNKSRNILQTIYIYSKNTKIEDLTVKICYGYPILKVGGEGSKSFEGDCVIIEKSEILPGSIESLSDKNFPVTTVMLDTNNTINLSEIVVDVEIKYYRKGIFRSYWKEIPKDNFIHWGMIATDVNPPFDIFISFFPDKLDIKDRTTLLTSL